MTDLDLADRVLRDAVAHGDVPGAVAVVRRRGEVILHRAHGWAAIEPRRIPMRLDTVFDLASLTKPLITAPVILSLIDRGDLDPDLPLRAYLPDAGPHGDATIRALLTHTAGLPASFHVYREARDREGVVRAITHLPLAYEPGTRVVYTCQGYILLGILAERITGLPLDMLADQMILKPLGLRSTGYRPEGPPERFAWTERGDRHERDHDGSIRWRSDFFPGQVHDGNAFHAMQAVSGNAGLFGTAEEVGIIGQMWLNGGSYRGRRILREETVRAATRDHTPGLEEGRGLGWAINRPFPDFPRSAGTLLSAQTFGHTGFTGTSLWVDPARDLVAVLLMNRIHPEVGDATPSIAVRHRFHDAVAQAIDAQ